MTRYQTIVATAGTSAVLGGNVGAAWLKSGAADRWLSRDGRLRAIGDADTAVQAVDRAWRSALGAGLEAHGKNTSAEVSAVAALARAERLAERPHIVLVHTDTFEGALAAHLTQAVLEERYDAAVSRVPVALDVADRGALRRSLGDFCATIATELRKGEPSTTAFAPLGGYKVLTSLGYLVGAYCRFPALYLHEDNQVLHEIPWVPITIDFEALAPHRSLLRRLDRDLQVLRSGLSSEEHRFVDERPWLIEQEDVDGDTYVAFGAFGRFLRKEPKLAALTAVPVVVAPSVVALAERHRARFDRELDRLLEQLRDEVQYRGTLHHEANWGHHGTRYALFKGNDAVRIAWRYDAEEAVLFVRDLWVDHDTYERELEGGGPLTTEPRGFVPWRGER